MLGETLIQQATRLNQERYQQEQGKLAPFAGQVVSVTPISDELGMSFGPAPNRSMPVQHPFVSGQSWIRSMPSVGTLYLMQNRFDTGQPEALKTIPTFSTQKALDFQSGLNAYRPLQSGEHDIASNGYACAYFSRRGNLDLRSGANIKTQLNRESQELMFQAPTVKTNLLFQSPGVMGDEVRLGVVKRWKTAAEEFYVKDGGNFTAEQYTQVLNPAKANPSVLFRRIEGQVYDDAGQALKHRTTTNALRSEARWYTKTDEYLSREIDENGNMLFDFPSTATTGFEVQISEGSYRMVIGKDRDITIDQDDKAVVQQNVHYTVGGDVTYEVSGKTSWTSEGITLETSSGAGLNVSPDGRVALGNSTGELLLLVYQLITALGTQTILTPLGYAAPIAASPQWQQVQTLLTQLQTMTGTL